VYGAGKADLIAAVQKDVSEQVSAIGIKIDKIYWIGEIRLPEVVLNSINAKNAATQMAQQRQNEVAQAKAEADKKIEDARGEAESILRVADAQAKANKLLAQSLTPEFVQYQAITKWNGELPKMTGSSAVPFIDVTGQANIQ
jgi:regulator of protease activity HflC (stomatin/prohibitin superfamily)